MSRKTPGEYAQYIRALIAERDSLAEENDELNRILDEIQALTGTEDDEDEEAEESENA